MSRVRKINEKILFVREYWSNLYFGKMDFFDSAYIVDMKSILLDLRDIIERVKNYTPRSGKLNYGDLPYICDEYIFYYKYTYFTKSELYSQLLIIKKEIESNMGFHNLKVDNIKKYKTSMKKIISNASYCILSIENNNNYFNSIFKEIQYICLSNYNLKSKIETIKVYLSELMSEGYEEEKSSDYLKNLFNEIGYRRIPLCNIKNFILLSQNKVAKKITYIFSIKNLYKQEPIKVGNILFYNPMRKDLLEYMAKEVWLEEDYRLLPIEKREIFDKYNLREYGCEYSIDKYDEYILETNCHARISIMAFDIREGLDRAKQEIKDVINLMYYFCEHDHGIKIEDSYIAFDDGDNEEIYQLSIQYENSFSKYKTLKDEYKIKESILDAESSLNKILSLKRRELLTKAIHWYNYAIKNNEINISYLGLFICIETLLTASNEYPTFKDKLLKIVPDVIIMSSYYNELINIYIYFTNVFSSITSGKYNSVPEDIISKAGLEKFLYEVDLNTFRNNFQIFYKYCESPYIKSMMIKYKKIYYNTSVRNNTINELRTKLVFSLSRIYRYRNQIVHEGEINKYQIKQNVEFLRYSTKILMDTAINDIKSGDVDEDIVKKISSSEISKHLSSWINSFI